MEITTPMLVDDTDFGLTSKEANRDFLENTLRKKPSIKKVGSIKLLKKDTVLPVYQSGGDSDEGYYWSDNQDQIVWLVKFRKWRRNWFPGADKKVLTQVALWRDDTPLLPTDFASKMFFRFILKRHKVVMSDNKEHTDRGMRFWKRRLTEALQKGYKVFFVDLNTQQSDEISSYDQMDLFFQKAWGKERSKMNFRWIIAEK